MKLITYEDFIDVYLKFKQRGVFFILSKFNLISNKRTESAFSKTFENTSNWWDIPYVTKRWNVLISGDENINKTEYLYKNLLNEKSNLKLLSLGSGTCEYEMALSSHSCFSKITCVDLAENRIEAAKKKAKFKGICNMEFVCGSIYDLEFKNNNFDIVLFNSSLHHFKPVEELIKEKVVSYLKSDGYLVINEYVGPNRMQYSKKQIKFINEGLNLIDKKYRVLLGTNLLKRKYYGSGIIRMIIADPSECIESIKIIPAIHEAFEVILEKSYGGNILAPVLKDISYNFLELDEDKINNLDRLFKFEDEYLKSNKSDFVFGIYKKK